MFKFIGPIAKASRTLSKQTLSAANLSQAGLFKLPIRQISSLPEVMKFVIENKEPISIATGILGYGINMYRARRTVTAKRLILIVRQAGSSDIPHDFDSIMKSAEINSKD